MHKSPRFFIVNNSTSGVKLEFQISEQMFDVYLVNKRNEAVPRCGFTLFIFFFFSVNLSFHCMISSKR